MTFSVFRFASAASTLLLIDCVVLPRSTIELFPGGRKLIFPHRQSNSPIALRAQSSTSNAAF